ncbi:MAG: hypothetical protein WCW52_04340 [Elusimicrobiales bacterium]|jgi:outer membrane protein OmpA-like peptidoglycan-associated protein
MKTISIPRIRAITAVFSALLVFGGNFSRLSGQGDPAGGGITRTMEQAIKLYHEGQDNEAMDRFMDILVKGTPAEKSLANEYITKITLRMNTGVQTFKDQGSGAGMTRDVQEPEQAPERRRFANGPGQAVSEEEASVQEERQAQKDRVVEKINEKIAEMRRTALVELSKSEYLKLYMGDPLPRCVTLNPQYFFSNETSFKAGATGTLSSLAGLIFTLGKANVLILPEGTVGGEVKIKSIRQAIALNSYLVSRGISQSRIDLNLTGGEVKLPKELSSLSGLILLFDYDKAPKLKESEDIRSKGPKVSLGVYPTAISIQKKEGALVEFSVLESPVGKPTWKFEIFSVQGDNTILSLQKLDGYGSQYNQSYWNGRKNFFGAAYPAGKYMFSVTAADAEGRETVIRRFLIIKPGPEEEKALAAKKPAAKLLTPLGKTVKAAPAGAARQKPAASKMGRALKGGHAGAAAARPKGKAAAGARKKTVRTPAVKKETEAGPSSGRQEEEEGTQESQTEFSGQVSYKIYFRDETAVVTPNSEKKLAQVAETMGYYPMAKVRLIGYAYSGEANSETMAQNRVNYVVTRLAGKYKIEKDRMDISTQISDAPKSIVEIKMLGKE